jgi:hypothetical protein
MLDMLPSHKITPEEKAAMQRIALEYVQIVNAELPNLRKGCVVHAIILGCAATLSSLCPTGMKREDYRRFTELGADTLIEQMLEMFGKY